VTGGTGARRHLWQRSHSHQIEVLRAVTEPVSIFRRNTNNGTKGGKAVATAGPTTDELEAVERIQEQFGTIIFGAPTRCHVCGGYGMVEHFDDAAGVLDNRCPACTNEWRITRAAIRQVNHARCIDLTSTISGVIIGPSAISRSAGSDHAVSRPIGDGILVRNLRP